MTTTSSRIFNFSAGPAVMPESVLERIREDVWNIDDSGIGVLEHSHRGPVIDRVFDEATDRCRNLAGLGDDHEVLFLAGGASMQFGMIPMNYLPDDATADYPDTGTWTTKAIKEARKFGTVNVAFDGSACGYDHCPKADELSLTPEAAYFHYCSNNTIYGTRYAAPPVTGGPTGVRCEQRHVRSPLAIRRPCHRVRRGTEEPRTIGPGVDDHPQGHAREGLPRDDRSPGLSQAGGAGLAFEHATRSSASTAWAWSSNGSSNREA